MCDPRGVVPPYARRFYHRISKGWGQVRPLKAGHRLAAPYEEMLRLNALKALKQQKQAPKKHQEEQGAIELWECSWACILYEGLKDEKRL